VDAKAYSYTRGSDCFSSSNSLHLFLMPYSTILPIYPTLIIFVFNTVFFLFLRTPWLLGSTNSVFNNQIAIGITLLYDLITGYQALKKADLLPKFPVR